MQPKELPVNFEPFVFQPSESLLAHQPNSVAQSAKKTEVFISLY